MSKSEEAGTLQKIEEAGLTERLTNLLDKHFTEKAKDEDKASLREAIDQHGLRANGTMKIVGNLQREGALSPGLYRELAGLHEALGSGSEEEAPSPVSPEEVSVVDGPKGVPDGDTGNVIELTEVTLTDAEEAKIKERMQKDEEKMRQRLVARETKYRERMLARKGKQAQRKGLSLEESQAIQERKAKLAEITEQLKGLREEAKKIRAEIRELRPKRPKRKKKDKEDGSVEKAPKQKKSKGPDEDKKSA